MRAKQATRAGTVLESANEVSPPLDCTSEGQEFLRGEKGEGGGGYRFFEIGATTGGG